MIQVIVHAQALKKTRKLRPSRGLKKNNQSQFSQIRFVPYYGKNMGHRSKRLTAFDFTENFQSMRGFLTFFTSKWQFLKLKTFFISLSKNGQKS